MISADDLEIISPRYAIWHAFDRDSKVELFSTAIRAHDAIAVVDPIPLSEKVRPQFEALGRVSTVFVTNANHSRAAAQFAERYSAVLSVPTELVNEFSHCQELTEGGTSDGFQSLRLEGAAPGEFAFYNPEDGGFLAIGDALINFSPYGFDLLPAKYCTNRKRMIQSLRLLLDLQFGRMFFAHGQPILSRARERFAALLSEL